MTLAARDSEVSELKARGLEQAAAIAKLEDALLQARAAAPSMVTPRRADNVAHDATPATRALVSTPVTDPALVPPAQQTTAAIAAVQLQCGCNCCLRCHSRGGDCTAFSSTVSSKQHA